VAGPAWLTKLGLWLRQPVDFWWISTVNFGPTFGVVVGIWFSNGDPPIVIVAALVGALFAFWGLFNFISNRRDAAVWFLVVVLTLAGESAYIIRHSTAREETRPVGSEPAGPGQTPASTASNMASWSIASPDLAKAIQTLKPLAKSVMINRSSSTAGSGWLELVQLFQRVGFRDVASGLQEQHRLTSMGQ
jgi:hypothetical protein